MEYFNSYSVKNLFKMKKYISYRTELHFSGLPFVENSDYWIFFSLYTKTTSCLGDEAAIPSGGVKPTFTERPVIRQSDEGNKIIFQCRLAGIFKSKNKHADDRSISVVFALIDTFRHRSEACARGSEGEGIGSLLLKFKLFYAQ